MFTFYSFINSCYLNSEKEIILYLFMVFLFDNICHFSVFFNNVIENTMYWRLSKAQNEEFMKDLFLKLRTDIKNWKISKLNENISLYLNIKW